jgi:hypothetical protein
MNPGVIIQWTIHSSLNGDNIFLDPKLEQLRMECLQKHLSQYAGQITLFDQSRIPSGSSQ